MRLNQNMNSLSIYNSYRKNLTANSSALDKLSSGTKINSAKDNPNKIGQSETMRMQLRSLQAAQRNLQDGSSMLQTADSALQEVNNSLTRMKELAVSAADGTKSVDDRKIIQTEIDQLKSNIDIGSGDIGNNNPKAVNSTERELASLRQLLNKKEEAIDYDRLGSAVGKAVAGIDSIVVMDKTIVGKKVAPTVKEQNNKNDKRNNRLKGEVDYV
ncbi:MAG: flagellin [Coprobacillus sp.]